MRLRTKLVLAATALTTLIVLVLSTMFLGELLRQRIEQTASSNDVLAHEVVLITRQAVESGLRQHPPANRSPAALAKAVTDALQSSDSLADVMQAVVRYSPTVEDVSVTEVGGRTVVSTDPDAVGQQLPLRIDLLSIRDENVLRQTRQVLGAPRVLDVRAPLDRNGLPFLIVHVGVRSTFVRASYEPWLRAALFFAVLATAGAVVVSGVIATAALQPIEQISRQLEHLTQSGEVVAEEPMLPRLRHLRGGAGAPPDAVVRVTRTIDRLGAQMRVTEADYTALRANVNQMLETLRDGVLLFGVDGRATMVSDSAAYFLENAEPTKVGQAIEDIFVRGTTLGDAVRQAYATGESSTTDRLMLEDGREVQVSLDRIGAGSGRPVGTLVRLRDMESAAQLERELEVSRRLAAVGRLTAGVGHEVKNPINAMVVHLELLRSKLARMDQEAAAGAQRHVDILAGEMQRLDRVVETLADFSRPMELHLGERSFQDIVEAVIELTEAEMDANGVRVLLEAPRDRLMTRVDGELMQQALLNLVLNGMQSMADGGILRLGLRRERGDVVILVADQGEGIPEEVLPRIFDLYFTTKPKGSGIGLAMTYRIVQMHGGSMSVRSTTAELAAGNGQEAGTAVEIRLPLSTGGDKSRKPVRAAANGPRSVGEGP